MLEDIVRRLAQTVRSKVQQFLFYNMGERLLPATVQCEMLIQEFLGKWKKWD